MKLWSVMAMALISTLVAVGAAESAPTVDRIYVATNGSDSWSGRLAAPNKTRTDGPLATLEGARDAIRRLYHPDDPTHHPDDPARHPELDSGPKHSALKRPITVSIRTGTYFLPRAFELTPQDTGTRECPITYEAYGGPKGVEKVTISGGRPITGFRPAKANGHDVIAVDVPEAKQSDWRPDQLFVNDRRADRTRLPKQGYYNIKSAVLGDSWERGQDSFTFNDGEIKSDWRNLSDIDVIAFTLWIEMRMPVKSVDDTSHTVDLAKRSTFWLANNHDKEHCARYCLENVFEALDTPGQWYLDRSEGTLYYYPLPGEDWRKAQFVAPKLCTLVSIAGTKEEPVEFVHFRNLRFAHNQYTLPADSAGSVQAAFQVPGAIQASHARDCSIDRCDISHIGTYACDFGDGASNCAVRFCSIRDMGAGGVKIGPGAQAITLSDNEIKDGGKIFASAIGVWVGNSPHNRVVHNTIADFYYTGVSLGWVWGYGQSNGFDNLVASNHIYNIGRGVLSDMGGVYTLGISPGTVIRNNRIHDCLAYSYGGWGIYTDEGSSGILIENNVVYNTKTGGFHQHYGKENTVTNNIFAFATVQQIQRTRVEEHISFAFERNIVYYDKGSLLGGDWSGDRYVMDKNLYFDTNGQPITFGGASFDEWKKRGHDEHSIIADPEFVDVSSHDFTLQSGSPAFKLGFKPIDVSNVGPREKPGVESAK